MPSEIKREISCFTADFVDGKVIIGGQTYPAGFYFVNSMNEYWKPYTGNDSEDFEIAQKLMVFRSNRAKVLDEIVLNHLNPSHAADLYNDVQYLKAYSRYTISNDHHNRMVYNYIGGLKNYYDGSLPLSFFTYIAGG